MLDLSSRLAPLCSAAVSIKGISFALPALRAWPGQLSMILPNASLTMLRSKPAHSLHHPKANRRMLKSWVGAACSLACRSHDLANCNADSIAMDLKKAQPAHSHDNISDLVVCHSFAQVNTTSPAAIYLPRSRWTMRLGMQG